ncbi:MAG: hypothetical protein KF916_04990 [Microbacteriaceae bacterium]|nr:hypothetical protein [Microbacteriaceae bacterium]
MGTKIAVVAITIAVGVYLFIIGQWAIEMMQSSEPVGVAMGYALFLLPVIGAWAIIREIWFGIKANKLAERLEGEELPGDGLPTAPSGRPLRQAADNDFTRWADYARENQDDWKAWYLLGIAYSNSGDQKRARASIRKAIKLSKV